MTKQERLQRKQEWLTSEHYNFDDIPYACRLCGAPTTHEEDDTCSATCGSLWSRYCDEVPTTHEGTPLALPLPWVLANARTLLDMRK